MYERVFTMKYHPKEGRLVLEAVALLDSPELFQLVEKELTALAFDVPMLVKSSTTYPSATGVFGAEQIADDGCLSPGALHLPREGGFLSHVWTGLV